jgi:hypothetical protein
MNNEHLHPSVTERLTLPEEQRIKKLRLPLWIGYPKAHRILDHFEALVQMPKKSRMPNALLVGPTNNGKTSILRKFEAAHPKADDPSSDAVIAPLIMIDAPPQPDETSLYEAILYQFSVPVRPRDHARNKRFQVIQILRQVGTQVLVIDEIQDLLAGDSRRQHAMLNVIKHLGNELQIPIIAAGVQSALNAIQIDSQLANRFEPLALPRWHFNDEFRSLLASFEKLIPLKNPSGLAGLKLAQLVFFMSEGIIGETASLLEKAAEKAIRGGKEKIDVETLESIGWIPPSERRRRVELKIQE